MSRARPSSRDALLTELMLCVFRVNGSLLAKGDQMVAPLGLTSARWQMLGAIALSAAPLTAPQAGDAMGVTRQAAQKQLNLLLAEGLVDMQANAAHQRSPLYLLSQAGKAVYAQAIALNQQWTRRLASPMTKAQIETALEVLRQLQQQLEGPLPTPA